MKKITLLYIILLTASITYCQQVPAVDQNSAISIVGGTIHVGDGTVIEDGYITFENGKITAIAKGSPTAKTANTIDASGKHLYPGFIAPNTTLGLSEIEAVRATRDSREVGFLNPNIRSIIAYNTDSKVTPTVRSNGVLIAQVKPEGGRISGTSSVVELDAWNWEDAAYSIDDGVHVNWPSSFSWNWRSRSVSVNKNYQKDIDDLKAFFKEAQAAQADKGLSNLKFDAMRDLFAKKKTLFIHVDRAKSIMSAVLFAKDFGLEAVIVGGEDSYMITDFLKENKVSIILGPSQSLPDKADSDIDQPFKTASQLEKAGILYCFSMDGSWTQRNLPFQAGQAIGFDLAYENGVKAITSNTAKILGIGDRVGTLAVGMDATLIISKGDALDMKTSVIEHAYIRGKKIDLDDKQKALYRKFRAKYQQ